MQALNKLGGKHGVGRVDMVENRYVGMKSRGVYETPGGAILHFAHRQMESLTMDREVMHQRDALIPKYAELVYNGFWFAPERLALQAYVTESQRNVTGTVRVKLYKGNIMVAGRKIPGEPLQPAHRHDGSRPDQGLQPGRRHRLHPAQRPAPESRGQGAKEQINMKLFNQTCLAFFLALPLTATAQTEQKSAPQIQVSVGDVTDNRTTGTFNSECKVELKFTGDAAADAQSVRRVQLSEASDTTDRDLIPKDDSENSSHSFGFGQSGGALSTEVKLRNPSRNATAIKVIKGQAELFNPTEANGGLLTIKGILQHPAEPIQNPALAKYNIQLIYLTKEAYDAKKKEVESQQNGDQKMGEAFGQLFKGMFGGMVSDSKNAIQLYVKDPDKRIIDLKFVDGQGNPLKSSQSWSSDDFRSTDFDSPPPPDTQVKIQLATPESLKTYSFQVENIALP